MAVRTGRSALGTPPRRRDAGVEKGGAVSGLMTAAKELDALYREERYAESELGAASELAPEDTVDSARERWMRARDALRARVPTIGARLHDEGGAAAMRAVLGLVDEKHRSAISSQWRGIGSFSG
jgi:hypothetical protein